MELTRATVCLVVGMLLSAAACHSDPGESVRHDGPIRVPPEHGWATTATVGQPFTDGLETLDLSGDKRAVIESITLDGDPELRLVGAQLAANDRGKGIIQYLPKYPPAHRAAFGDVVPAEGATIRPRGPNEPGPELLLGIEVTEPGRFVRQEVVVTYRVDGETFEARLPAQLIVCTVDFAAADGSCA